MTPPDPNQWKSIRTLVSVTEHEYLDWQGRKHGLDIRPYLSAISTTESPCVPISETKDRIEKFNRAVRADTVIGELTEARLSTPVEAALADTILASVAILLDLRSQYSDFPTSSIVDELEEASRALQEGNSETATRALSEVADTLVDRIRLIRMADEIVNILSNVTFGHSADDIETARDSVNNAVDAGDFERVYHLHQMIACQMWTHQHFDAFDYRDFERLVADLYRYHGYEVRQTEQGPDGGIDIIAQDDGKKKFIQVKHHSKTIGRPDLDQYVALHQYYDINEMVLVTSSSFTKPAIKRWQQVSDNVRLIDGETLVSLLTNTEIVPPISGE